jgi:hypothetical protein
MICGWSESEAYEDGQGMRRALSIDKFVPGGTAVGTGPIMPRKHPICFVCREPLGDGSASSTMRMTWRGLPGKPEIGMHWPECCKPRDGLWRRLKDQIRTDIPREHLERFLADVARRDARCLVRNKR